MSSLPPNQKFRNIRHTVKQKQSQQVASSSLKNSPSPNSATSFTPDDLLAKEAIRIIHKTYATVLTKLLQNENLAPATFYNIVTQLKLISRSFLRNILPVLTVYKKYVGILESCLEDEFNLKISQLVQTSTKILDQCRNQFKSEFEAFLVNHPNNVDLVERDTFHKQLHQTVQDTLELELRKNVRIGEPSQFQNKCLQHYIDKFSNKNKVHISNEKVVPNNPPNPATDQSLPTEPTSKDESKSNFPIEQTIKPELPLKNVCQTSTILPPPPLAEPPEALPVTIDSNDQADGPMLDNSNCLVSNNRPSASSTSSSITLFESTNCGAENVAICNENQNVTPPVADSIKAAKDNNSRRHELSVSCHESNLSDITIQKGKLSNVPSEQKYEANNKDIKSTWFEKLKKRFV